MVQPDCQQPTLLPGPVHGTSYMLYLALYLGPQSINKVATELLLQLSFFPCDRLYTNTTHLRTYLSFYYSIIPYPCQCDIIDYERKTSHSQDY